MLIVVQAGFSPPTVGFMDNKRWMGGIYRCVFFMYIIFVLRNNNLQFYYVYRDWRQLSLTTTRFCHNHLCIRPPNPSNTSTACFHSTARVFTTIATWWAPAVQHHLAGWFIPPCRTYVPVFSHSIFLNWCRTGPFGLRFSYKPSSWLSAIYTCFSGTGRLRLYCFSVKWS